MRATSSRTTRRQRPRNAPCLLLRPLFDRIVRCWLLKLQGLSFGGATRHCSASSVPRTWVGPTRPLAPQRAPPSPHWRSTHHTTSAPRPSRTSAGNGSSRRSA